MLNVVFPVEILFVFIFLLSTNNVIFPESTFLSFVSIIVTGILMFVLVDFVCGLYIIFVFSFVSLYVIIFEFDDE